MPQPLRSLSAPEPGEAPSLPARRAARACDVGLTGTTRRWLRRLPQGRRPLRLCELYPRVANRIAWFWADVAIREQTLADLLEDRRGGRRGFPPCVVRELQRLREFDGQLSADVVGAPWWRAMVMGVRN